MGIIERNYTGSIKFEELIVTFIENKIEDLLNESYNDATSIVALNNKEGN
jgi:hypothetical protein